MKKIQILFCLLLVVAVSYARKKVPVILVAGQSNADGRVPLAELPDEMHRVLRLWDNVFMKP